MSFIVCNVTFSFEFYTTQYTSSTEDLWCAYIPLTDIKETSQVARYTDWVIFQTPAAENCPYEGLEPN